jgi:hypothetical protein
MKRLKPLLSLFALCLLLNSCVVEELNQCPDNDNLVLWFDSLSLDFGDHVNKVDLGIYNTIDGKIVKSLTRNTAQLREYPGVNLYLPAGEYDVVAWGNAFDNTKIGGLENGSFRTSGYVTHPAYGTPLTIPTNDSLYYGARHIIIYGDSARVHEYTVGFLPAHISFSFTVTQLPNISTEKSAQKAIQKAAQDDPFIRVNNLLPVYDFNMITSGDLTSYYPPVQINTADRTMRADCDVLRFETDNPISIEVIENIRSQKILAGFDLADFLRNNKITIQEGKEVHLNILIELPDPDHPGDKVRITIKDWSGVPTETL